VIREDMQGFGCVSTLNLGVWVLVVHAKRASHACESDDLCWMWFLFASVTRRRRRIEVGYAPRDHIAGLCLVFEVGGGLVSVDIICDRSMVVNER